MCPSIPNLKSFGQHFLKDPNKIQAICNTIGQEDQGIIEIGPGIGALTKELVTKGIPYLAVEIDLRFKEILAEIVDLKYIHFGDALKIDLAQFLHQYYPRVNHWHLVSNLPYNVGTPLLRSFIPLEKIKSLTLMFQKEVAEKILPKTQKNTQNSLHLLCLNYFELFHITDVPPGCFSPPPQVESQVLHLTRRTKPFISLDSIGRYESFLRNLFGQKRKQIGKILMSYYSQERMETYPDWISLKTRRSETLSQSEVMAIFRWITP